DALARALTLAGGEVVRVPLANATAIRGRNHASGVDTTSGRVECDLVAAAAIPSPASEGPRQAGCEVVLDPPAGGFRVVVDAAGATQLARLTGQPPAAIPPFTSRPPLAPTPLRLLARDPSAHRFDDDDAG